jgi:hypothetical protein
MAKLAKMIPITKGPLFAVILSTVEVDMKAEYSPSVVKKMLAFIFPLCTSMPLLSVLKELSMSGHPTLIPKSR